MRAGERGRSGRAGRRALAAGGLLLALPAVLGARAASAPPAPPAALAVHLGPTAIQGSSIAGCAARLAVGGRPPACWRPYSDASPFNLRLPTAPRLAPRSAALVAHLARRRPPSPMETGKGGYDYDHATYFATLADPVYTVHCTRRWGRCPPEGRRFRIPARARPAGHRLPRAAADRHLTVVQPDGNTTLELWRADDPGRRGGRLRAAWGGVTRLDGSGLGSGSTAADFGGFAGVIRPEEILAGRIDHALFAVVPCTTGHVYPAGKGAAPCRPGDGPGLPNGARLRLEMSDAEIAALGGPPWTATVLRALREYGMIVGDTGGDARDAFRLQFESGAVDRAYGRRERLDAYAAAAGLPHFDDPAIGRRVHLWRLPPSVDWARRLRVVAPCVSRRTC